MNLDTGKTVVGDRRLTVEALRYYVPIFQKADIYYEEFLESPDEDPLTLARLDASFKLREMTVDYLMELAKPLMVGEIKKMISSSHLRSDPDESIFDLLYYAGRGGAIRGLRHFNVELMDKSATNYLFMWITTYAKKELNAIEAAPFGIPPARFNIYKKISAVRKKLSERLERYATNEEVLDYFHSGRADMKSNTGRKANSGKLSKANQNMTLEHVKEQEHFERNLISQNLVDPLDHQMGKDIFGLVSNESFEDTLFGAFLRAYPFTERARVALMSEMQVSMNARELELLESMDTVELRRLNLKWKALMKSKHGLLREFLERVRNDGYTELDIPRTIDFLDKQPSLIKDSQWRPLLEENWNRES